MDNNNIKLGLVSLGCPKNLADLEALMPTIKDHLIVSPKDAEIILLNTCGFLKKSRDEVFENIENFKKKKIILLGCLAGKLKKDIFKKYKQVCAVVSSAHYWEINTIIKYVRKGEKIFAVSNEPEIFEDTRGKILLSPLSHSYIKIAEGCNNKCSYCLIPSLKGRYRSRKMEDILAEVKELVNLGVKEIILVAQDCGCYGIDLFKEKKLAELVEKMARIKGDFWVRILYIYPETIDEKLLKIIASSKKILRYLDIPLQHGDPGILKKMNRPDNIKKTLEKINKIRKILPGITLSGTYSRRKFVNSKVKANLRAFMTTFNFKVLPLLLTTNLIFMRVSFVSITILFCSC